MFTRFLIFTIFAGLAAPIAWATSAAEIPNDPNFSDQSYLQQIRASDAWGFTKGSKRVVVALIDSGVEYSHPDLQENIWTNPAETLDGIDNDGNGLVDDIHGWDFIENQSNPGPNFQAIKNDLGFHHGTIVAGIIGAVGNNGTAGVGINWQVSIMPLRALNGVGDSGDGEPVGVINAINYAIAHRVDVINMSFIGKKVSPTLVNTIRLAHESGITIIAAAGNEGNGSFIDGDLDFSPRYPVCIDGPQGEPWWVIGVAAVDNLNRKASFSGYGRNCIDISAPGVHIPSTLVIHPAIAGFGTIFGGLFSGTSLAAPQVTAAVALLKSIKPDLTPKQIYDILTSTADSIDKENPFYAGELGAGILNVSAAVQKVRAMVPVPAVWFGSTNSPFVVQIDNQGIIQRKFTFNYGKGIGVSLARARNILNNNNPPLVVTGSANVSSRIRIFNDDGLSSGKEFITYPKEYNGGIQIAVGDVDGDGEDEIITAPASRYKPEVRIYSFIGVLKNKFLAYAPGARLGMSIALADINDDNILDIITGVRVGGSAHIRMFDYNGTVLNKGFFAAQKSYRGGVNIAAINMKADGGVKIVTVPIGAPNPTVRVFNLDGILVHSATLNNEKNSQFSVTIGDTQGNGSVEILVANTGKHPGLQRFNTNLENLDPLTTQLSSKDFRGLPMVLIAP